MLYISYIFVILCYIFDTYVIYFCYMNAPKVLHICYLEGDGGNLGQDRLLSRYLAVFTQRPEKVKLAY